MIYTPKTKLVDWSVFFKVPQAKKRLIFSFFVASGMQPWYKVPFNVISVAKSTKPACQVRFVDVKEAKKSFGNIKVPFLLPKHL